MLEVWMDKEEVEEEEEKDKKVHLKDPQIN